MVMILMSIGHLFRNDDLNSNEDDSYLREEVDNKETVVSKKSAFYNFLVKAEKERCKKEEDSEKTSV